MRPLTIHLATYSSTWGNSTNFEQFINVRHYHPIFITLPKMILQANKVVKSKAFDFNSYWNTIELNTAWEFKSQSE